MVGASRDDSIRANAWGPSLLHLTACTRVQARWNQDEMNASVSAYKRAVYSALENSGAARKAGLHASAMVCALEGSDLVIPPPPGVRPMWEHLIL